MRRSECASRSSTPPQYRRMAQWEHLRAEKPVSMCMKDCTSRLSPAVVGVCIVQGGADIPFINMCSAAPAFEGHRARPGVHESPSQQEQAAVSELRSPEHVSESPSFASNVHRPTPRSATSQVGTGLIALAGKAAATWLRVVMKAFRHVASLDPARCKYNL